jgi:hypothetical protein
MDNILTNTLAGTQPLPATPKGLQVPELTGNNSADIATLSAAQKKPSLLMDFQKVMQNTARQGYQERQKSDMELASQQFDPAKVSGGTFAGIIGNLEQQRGADISKIYSSTMNTYQKVQDTITERMEFLQNLEEQKRQFEAEMKLRKKEIKMLEKQNKQAAKIEKQRFEMEKKNWEMEYSNKKTQLKQDTSYLSTQLEDILFNQYSGQTNQTQQNFSNFSSWLNGSQAPAGVKYDALGQGISTRY